MRELIMSGLLIGCFLAGSVIAPASAQSAVVTLGTHTEGTTYIAGRFDVVLQVDNSGVEALSSVTVTAEHDCWGELGPPTELSGNGDDVLDPTESWEYRCTTVAALHGITAFAVTAVESVGGVIEASARAEYKLLTPLVVDVKPSKPVIHAGESVTWTGIVANISDFDVVRVGVHWTEGCTPTDAATDLISSADSWTFTCNATLAASTEFSGGVAWAPIYSPGTGIATRDTRFASHVTVIRPKITMDVITPTGGVFSGEVFPVDFIVTNVGDDVLASFLLEPGDACYPSIDLVTRSEGIGNDDLLFDPGEVWSYHAPRCLTWATDRASADVKFEDSMGTANSERVSVEYVVRPPLEAQSVGDVVVAPGSTVTIQVFVTNVSPIRVEPLANMDTAELWITDEHGTGMLLEHAPLVPISGNGDSIVDPAEVWTAEFAYDAGPDLLGPRTLAIRLTGWNPDEDIPADSGDRFGWPYQRIGTLATGPAASTTSTAVAASTVVTPTLPATGGDHLSSGLTAGIAIGLGTLLVAATYRPRRSGRSNQR